MSDPFRCPNSTRELITQMTTNSTLDIPTILSMCPDICALVWKIGSPQLAGIGGFISRIMQVAVSLLCGLFPSAFYLVLANNVAKKLMKQIIPSYQNIFIDTSAAYGTAVGIALIVHQSKNQLQIYEILSMQIVSLLLVFSQLSVYVTTCVIAADPSVRQEKILICKRMILTAGCIGVELFNALSLVEVIRYNRFDINWPLAEKLVGSCGNGKIPIFHPLPRNPLVGTSVGVVVATSVLLVLPIIRLYEPVQWLVQWVAAFLSLAFAIGASYLAVVLGELRGNMKKFAGNDSEDNTWEFGQIIAVFLWIPICLELLLFIYRWKNKAEKLKAEKLEAEKFDNLIQSKPAVPIGQYNA